MISLTEKAVNKIVGIMKEQKVHGETVVRVGVKGGGCSGFKYDFSFDNKQDADDLKHENILIDKKSAELLKGSEVDYVKELIGDNFKISNPQSKSSCGCGVSFSL